MVNFSSLKTQAEMALAKLTEGKYYELSGINQRLQKVANDYPHDTVIIAVSRVVEQLSNKNPSGIISQGEIEKIYNELIGLNVSGTKFRDVLGDLLISEKPKSATSNEKYALTMRDNPDDGQIEYDCNTEVKAGFEKLFNQISDKYDPQKASLAREKVGLELNSLGFNNVRVKIAGGNSKFLVFAADIDTNRGSVRVYIPTEASGEKFPSVFVSGNQFDELKKSNLSSYVTESSFRNSRLPNVSSILNTLNILTSETNSNNEEFSKIASFFKENGNENLSAPELFASIPDQNSNLKDVQIPLTEVPKPLKVLASQIEENIMEASVGFPQSTVRFTKKMLVAELNSMGFKNSQIRVKEATSDGFICEATINTPKGKMPIEIPIEIKGNFPLLPSVFAKGDYISEFNTANIKNLVMKNTENHIIVRDDDLSNGMSLAQLKEIIVKSAMSGDYDKCDDTIAIIEKKFGEDVYRNVVADYYKTLINVGNVKDNLTASYNDSDQFVKTPNSLYPIHKKFGRPAHDLIRDENGEYHLKSTYSSRQNQKEEGAFFSTAKVLVGD